MTKSKARSEMSRPELYAMIDELQETIAIVAERIRDGSLALRTPSEGVKVKPLIWRNNSGSRNATSKCADTPFGLYDYSKYGADWAVYGQGTLIAEPEDEAGCIAAAQADYEQRILSALTGKE